MVITVITANGLVLQKEKTSFTLFVIILQILEIKKEKCLKYRPEPADRESQMNVNLIP